MTIQKIFINFLVAVIFMLGVAHASSIPTLTLSNLGSSIRIAVKGDASLPVLLYYSNTSDTTRFTSIDIGQTDSSGNFVLTVSPSSYGLNAGSSVYVAVGSAYSSRASWPASANSSQSGGLVLSSTAQKLIVGQSANVVASNSADALSIGGNTNSAVVYATVKDSVVSLNASSAGVSTVTICGTSNNCGTVLVTVTAPDQTVSFSQTQAYVVVGQAEQSISLYGPGNYYGLTVTNKDIVSARIDGNNLYLKGLLVGRVTVSVCATGFQCGSLVVNSLSSGSEIPTTVNTPAPDYSGQPPQLSSVTMSSNNVYGLFFGPRSTLTINFSANQPVNNVQVKVNGSDVSPAQGTNSSYTASYMFTGNEVLPVPVSIVFTNAKGQVGKSYLWVGDAPASVTKIVASTAVNSSGKYVFSKQLREGMKALGTSDPDVIALQQHLKALGLYSGPITGYFGPQTKKAVQAYQKKHGLNQLGEVGPSTRALLNKGL